MFERYTQPARRVIFSSRYMAAQTGSPKIETEHLLLGLLRADTVLAKRFLGSPWVAEQIWQEVEHKKPGHPPIPAGVDLRLSPEGKHVLRLAADETADSYEKGGRTSRISLCHLAQQSFLFDVVSGNHMRT